MTWPPDSVLDAVVVYANLLSAGMVGAVTVLIVQWVVRRVWRKGEGGE